MDNDTPNLTSAQLREAAAITDQIEQLQADLEAILSGGAPPAKRRGRKPGSKNKSKDQAVKVRAKKKRGGKRKISPEGIERIRAAQKARWANAAKTKKAKKGK